MWIVKYQGTTWELNDWVMAELIAEGIVNSPASENNPASVTDKFHDDWGHKTYEAFAIAVASMQAIQTLEEGCGDLEEIENAKSNMVDAVIVLKGGRV